MSDWEFDLVVLVADSNMKAAVRGLLSRTESLGIPPISSDVFPHPERDPGCLQRSHHFLRPFLRRAHHALVMFDRMGCGRESLTRESLESQVAGNLRAGGWEDRAAVLVLDPELEIWVWSNSPHVEQCLGWAGKDPDLRTWLQGLRVSGEPVWADAAEKPKRPKLAVEQALRQVRKPRSSAIYAQLAKNVSLARCSDPGFQRFRMIVTGWFGAR